MRNFKIVFQIILLSIFISCKNSIDSEQIVIAVPDLPPPSGIVWLDETGSQLGTFGSPNNGSIELNISLPPINQSDYIDTIPHVIPNQSYVRHPFPNPVNQKVNLYYGISKASYIAIWISEAYGNSNSESLMPVGQGMYYISSDQKIKDIETFAVKPAGYRSLEWDTKDKNGNNVPKGYYRIFTLIDKRLYWHNIYVYRDESDLELFFN